MNKRKLLLVALSLCMVAILAMGGTLAYLTDTDAKDNTFTVGNVDIHIDEWMEDGDDEGTEWDVYTDKQHLNPIAQSKAPFNKMVETVNDGTEDAYIRTYVTCPTDMYWYLGLGFNSGANAKTSTNNDGKNMYALTSWSDVGNYMIDGEETSVFVCEYKGIVEPGESVLSLTKVWLYENVDNAEIKEFGLTDSAFKVKVASQAIQAENLTYDEAMTELGTHDEAVKLLFGGTPVVENN